MVIQINNVSINDAVVEYKQVLEDLLYSDTTGINIKLLKDLWSNNDRLFNILTTDGEETIKDLFTYFKGLEYTQNLNRVLRSEKYEDFTTGMETYFIRVKNLYKNDYVYSRNTHIQVEYILNCSLCSKSSFDPCGSDVIEFDINVKKYKF